MSLKGEVPRPALAVRGEGIVEPSSPVLRADDHGVLRGDGVFETVRIHTGRPFLLDPHLDRLAISASRADIALPARGAWLALVDEALTAYGSHDGALRLVSTRGPEGGEPTAYALVTPVPESALRAREHGVRAVTLSLGITAGARRDAPWLLGGVKTTSYAVAMAAIRHAEALGYDDALWLSVDGQVLEAPTATVGWVRDGTLVSPHPAEEVGILAGTTLGYVAELARQLDVPVELRPAQVEELRAADEAMLLSSVRGIAPLLQLDDRPIGDGTPGPVTKRLAGAYEDAVASA
ncbi:MAG: aminotransferase class IV [Mycobacteriales bacterium]